MATLKQRLHRKNSSGTYDIVHLETSASCVLMSDGTTAEAAINNKAASSHNHAAGNINSGTLAVARLPTVTVAKGGTGKTTLTSGSYLVGAGTSAVTLKTPAEVLAHIGAAANSNFVKSGSTAAAGLVPAPPTTAGTTKYLREDGTWQVPPDTNTTYTLSSITGTLAVAKGGTGATTDRAAEAAINGNIPETTEAIGDTFKIVFKRSTPDATNGAFLYRQASLFWNYIKGKADSVYAASSHNHAAGNITSGTLAVARGGTGAATATANYVFAAPNGSNGAPSFRKLVAADIPSLAASKITSGTLGVARGGTGVTSLDALKTALGVGGNGDLHWWRKRTNNTGYQTKLGSTGTDLRIYTGNDDGDGSGKNTTNSIQYASSVSVNSNGDVILVNPSTINVSYNNQSHSTLKGKYIKPTANHYNGSNICYIPTDATTSRTVIDGSDDEADYYDYLITFSKYQSITSAWVVEIGAWEYISSTSSNTYTSGVSNGVEYEYIGIPNEYLQYVSRFSNGHYRGTGVSGENNPNTIVCNFTPKIVMVTGDSFLEPIVMMSDKGSIAFRCFNVTNFSTGTIKYTISGNTVTWYTTSTNSENYHNSASRLQLNKTDTDYFWFAFG